jgi:hypothetical protein
VCLTFCRVGPNLWIIVYSSPDSDFVYRTLDSDFVYRRLNLNLVYRKSDSEIIYSQLVQIPFIGD